MAGLSWLPWPLHIIKRKIGHYYDREKIGQHQKKDTLEPKKVRIAFALLLLLLLFFFTPFFYDFKGIKIKEKDKDKVRIRPFLDGYGLGTRIRTTLVRILIPGPAADPLLRIYSPARLKSTD